MTMRGDHTIRMGYATAVYWKGNSACGHEDDWTRCEVFPAAGNVGGGRSFDSVHQSDCDRFILALSAAYNAGKTQCAKDIRYALGILE